MKVKFLKIKAKYLTFLIIIGFLGWLFIYDINYKVILNGQKIRKKILNNELIEKFNFNECNPLNTDFEQYSVNINEKRYPQYLSLYINNSINFKCLNQRKTLKKIFLWNKWFYDVTIEGNLGIRKPFENLKCPVTNCELLNDKSRINESDYVVVYMWNNFEEPPAYRPDYQRWIFMLYESPLRSPDYSAYNRVFNLTSTYKVDSDFPGFYQSYSNFIWKENITFNQNYDFSSGKLKFAAAVISNCGYSEKSKRLIYIDELKKYIDVDVFGKCGKKCPTHFKHNKKTGDCKEIISFKYKFYLSFENSICNEYITEKFFQILKYNIIPVVYGGGEYDRFIPTSGYIDVRDFSSPKDLAEYLSYLDKNRTAYNSYFKWKKHVNFKDIKRSPLCDMCIKLNLEDYFGIQKSILKDVGSYWNKKIDCKLPVFQFEKKIFKLNEIV